MDDSGKTTYRLITWWRHQMETFSALLAICAGNSPVTGEFPTQRPVTRSFDIFFDLRLNKRLSKHSRGLWLETPCNERRRTYICGENMSYNVNHISLPVTVASRRSTACTSQLYLQELVTATVIHNLLIPPGEDIICKSGSHMTLASKTRSFISKMIKKMTYSTSSWWWPYSSK